MGRSSIPVFAAALFVLNLSIALADPAPTTKPSLDSAALEKQFSELLTGATLVGSYTIEGRDATPKEDQYKITKAVKGDGDNWDITSSIEYRGYSIPVTLAIPVKWAGDTPVMELTNMQVPGIGTFTARVLFYGDHYVGTWSGGRGHGGAMWGKIEHIDPTTKPAAK